MDVLIDREDWNYMINIKLSLAYALMGQINKSKEYYIKIETSYDLQEEKYYWSLYKINKIYSNNAKAMAYLDSTYYNLIKNSKKFTSDNDRQRYLHFDKYNKRIQEEWEKVK